MSFKIKAFAGSKRVCRENLQDADNVEDVDDRFASGGVCARRLVVSLCRVKGRMPR